MTQVEVIKNGLWAIMMDGYIENIKDIRRSYKEVLMDEALLFPQRRDFMKEKLEFKENNTSYLGVYTFLNFLIHYHRNNYCHKPNGPLFASIFTSDNSMYSIKKYIDEQSKKPLEAALPSIINDYPKRDRKDYLQIVTICQPPFDNRKLHCQFRNTCIDNWSDNLPFNLRPRCRYENRDHFAASWKQVLNHLVSGLRIDEKAPPD